MPSTLYPWEDENRYSLPYSIPPHIAEYLSKPIGYYSASQGPIRDYEKEEEEKKKSLPMQVMEGVKDVGSGVIDAFGRVIGAPAQYVVHPAFRGIANFAGGDMRPDETPGAYLQRHYYPEKGEGGIVDQFQGPLGWMLPPVAAERIGRRIGEAVTGKEAPPSPVSMEGALLDEGPLRSSIGAAAKFALDMAYDPVMYAMPAMAAKRQAEVYGAGTAARIGGQVLGEAGISEFAPKLAQWAQQAETTLPDILKGSKLRSLGEKVLHRGFQAQMGIGAVEGTKAGVEALREGDWTRAGGAFTEAAISGGMLALPPALARRTRGVVAKAFREGQRARSRSDSITPFGDQDPLPIDSLPAELRPHAGDAASRIAKDMVRLGEGYDIESTRSILHSESTPEVADVILRQALHNAEAIKEGGNLISRVRSVFGDRGPVGVHPEGQDKKNPSNFFLVQRARNRSTGKIEVVGASQVDGGSLTFLAGGRAMDSPVSSSPMYEALDAMGVNRSGPLSAYGREARSNWERKWEESQGADEQGRPIPPTPDLNQTPIPSPIPSEARAFAQVGPGRTEIGDTGLYSRLREVVDSPKTQRVQTGDQWLRFLSDPQRQVKKLEMGDTGLDEYLRSRSSERVTREEVQEYLDRNQTKLTEVVRGERVGSSRKLEWKPFNDPERGPGVYNNDFTIEDLSNGKVRMSIRGAGLSELYNSIEEAQAVAQEMVRTGRVRAVTVLPRYHRTDYNTKGGAPSSYTERLLVTQPRGNREDPAITKKREEVYAEYKPRIGAIADALQRAWHGPRVETDGILLEVPEIKAEVERVNGANATAEKNFNDYMEKLKVDFPEAFPNGRFDYFILEKASREALNKLDELDNAKMSVFPPHSVRETAIRLRNRLEEEMDSIVPPPPETKDFESSHWEEPNVNVHIRHKDYWGKSENGPSVQLPGGQTEKFSPENPAHAGLPRGERILHADEFQSDISNKILDLRAQIKKGKDAGRDTTFSEQELAQLESLLPMLGEHTDLAVKRLLKYASDSGYDRVTWTTGDTQLKRWRGLAAQVSDVLADRTPSGEVRLRGVKDGRTVADHTIKESELHRYVGRKVSEDLIRQMDEFATQTPKKKERVPRPKATGTVLVMRNNDMFPVEVPSYPTGVPGLVVTKSVDEGRKSHYHVTHVKSGFRVNSSEGLSLQNALLHAKELGEVEIDWNIDEAGIRALPTGTKDYISQINRKWKNISQTQTRTPAKITSQAHVTGSDLAVGGAGKRAYYDEILPNVIRKWGGKFGAGKTEEFQLPVGGGETVPVHSLPLTEESRSRTTAEGYPLYQVGGQERAPIPTREAVPPEVTDQTRALLLRLYPDNTYIRQNPDSSFTIDLPESRSSGPRTVLFRPGVDRIQVSVSDIQSGHGEEAARGVESGSLRIPGATWVDLPDLPNAAIVHILSGADSSVPVHEHWHVIRFLGNLSPEEIGKLEKAYPAESGGKTSEERQADAFASWLNSQRPHHTIFTRIFDALKEIGRFLTGGGVTPQEREIQGIFSRAQETGLATGEGESYPGGRVAESGPSTLAATRPVVPIPTRQASDFIPENDQRRNLNWHLAASGQEQGRKGAKYAGESEPNPSNSLRLNRDGKPFFVGPITPEQWLEKAKSWVGEVGSPEWVEARNWYRDLRAEFDRVYGPEEGEKMLTLWGMTQQRASPSQGLQNLLRVEDVVRGFRSKSAPKGGLAHDRILAALKGLPPSLGQKLSDFADAVHNRTTRQWVGHDPRGGAPAPVDVHAGRDVGFIDDVVKNRVAKYFGKDVADRLESDLPQAPTDGQYYYGHDFYNKVAKYLNENGVDSGNWTPAEAQAVGWMAQQNMLGTGSTEGPKHIFGPSTSYVAVEAAPGSGSPRESVWGSIPETNRAKVSYDHIHDIAEEAAKLTGVRILSRTDTSGVWQQYENPNVVFEALNPDAALRFAKVMAAGAHQSEVWAQRLSPKSRANALGVDLESPQGYDFSRRSDVVRFWQSALGSEPGLGASVVRGDDGTPLLRVLADSNKDAARVVDALRRWQGGTVKYEINPVEVQKTINDWRKHGGGESHTKALRGVGPAALADFLRRAEESFQRRAKEGIGGGESEGIGSEVPRPGEPALDRPLPPTGEEALQRPVARAAVGPLPGQNRASGSPTAPAPGVSPLPPPPPLSTGRATGNPPRVESRVQNLKDAVVEQRRLGVKSEDLILDRYTRRTWESLDDRIKKMVADWDDDTILRTMEQRHLEDYETQALDAVTRGRHEAKEEALLEYKSAKGTPGEAQSFDAYSKALAKYIVLDRANVNDGTGLARALNARNRIMAAQLTPDRQLLRQILREIPGISEGDAARLVSLWETGDPRTADAFRAQFAGNMSKFWILHKANLISIPSEFANIFGNTLTQVAELGDRASSSLADWVISKATRRGRERYLREASVEMGAMAHGVIPALQQFAHERLIGIYKRAWTGESRPIIPGTPIEHQVSPFKTKLGRLAASPLDALGVADDAFQKPLLTPAVTERMAYRIAAQSLGKAHGPDVDSETARIVDEIRTYPEKHKDTINQIQSEVERRVYREKPSEIIQHVQQFVRSHRWLNLVVPFIKTPANVTRYAIRHSPLGILPSIIGKGEMAKAYRDYKSGKISQGDFADTLAPRITGSLIAAGMVTLAKAGLITGAGPVNPNDRKAKLATGWQPYSMVFTGTDGRKIFVPYSRFEPIAQVMGMAADAQETSKEKTLTDAVTRIGGTIATNITNRTFLKGLSDFANAYSNPQQYLSNVTSNIFGAITPGTMDKLAIAIDPVYRDTSPRNRGITGFGERIGKTLLSQTPGASRFLPARHTATGEESLRPGAGAGVAGSVARFLSPIVPTFERPGTELEAAMAEYGAPSSPRPYVTIDRVRIPLRPYEMEVMNRADEKAAQELRRLITTGRFQSLPDTIDEGGNQSKEAVIQSVYTRHRSEARQRLLRSSSFRSYARDQISEARS